jgi:hypothetical protein
VQPLSPEGPQLFNRVRVAVCRFPPVSKDLRLHHVAHGGAGVHLYCQTVDHYAPAIMSDLRERSRSVQRVVVSHCRPLCRSAFEWVPTLRCNVRDLPVLTLYNFAQLAIHWRRDHQKRRFDGRFRHR